MRIFSIMGLLVCCVAMQANASVVYEGFDYTVGDPVIGQTGGDGWAGAWGLGGGTNPSHVRDGLTLDAQPVSGGAAQRPARAGNGAISRTISNASQTTLTADGTTIWFSVLMRSFASTGSGATDGYALNSHGTLILGDTELTGGSGTMASPIGANGNAVGVGFAGTPSTPGLFENVEMQGVTYEDGVLTENIDERIVAGSNTVMVVGKVEWAANGSNDTVTLYHVVDPAAGLPTAFSTMEVDLNQSTFNVVSIGDSQTSVFDEIRFGTSPTDVGMVPLTLAIAVEAPNDVVLSWEGRLHELYDVEETTDLAADPVVWDPIPSLTNLTGVLGSMMATTTVSSTEAAYRLHVFGVPTQTVYETDFEGMTTNTTDWTWGSDGGAGTAWELGTPTTGPSAANSGTNCWGTNLDDFYDSSADVWLRSPVIDLSTAASATLKFWNFKDIEDYATLPAGVILNVLDATGTTVLQELARQYDSTTEWTEQEFRLTGDAVGQPIMLEFRFFSDEFVVLYYGWYVDDVSVTVP